MKKITTLAVVLLSIISISAHADSSKTIAIIDTGYDATVSQFAGKVIYEACFSALMPTCPNKNYTQEGPGSAVLNSDQLKIGMAAHGTQMLSVSIFSNPNTNFVYIRAYGITNSAIVGPSDSDLSIILKWILKNNSKLNIGAVTFSGGRNITSCSINNDIVKSVNDLNAVGIPVIMAAGNDYNNKIVNFPSCLDPVISIGATDSYGHALYSNSGSGIDFDANGSVKAYNYGGALINTVGTSTATQVFGAYWMAIKQANPSLTYSQEYALIQKTTTFSSNSYVKNVPTINLAGALKP
jgi:hypothetical protein